MRDRLSSDLLRIVSQFGTLARAPGASAWGYVPAGDALAVLNHCIGALAALRGIEMENMTRGPGWRFLNIGRRIERSIHLVKLFRAIIVPLRLGTWPALEMLLEVADSSMTYRARYFTTLQAAPALDLLMNDEANPRSLAFQVKDLTEHCRSLVEHAFRSRMASFQTETFGGSSVQSVSRGYRAALPAGHERRPRAARRTCSVAWKRSCPTFRTPSRILISVTRRNWSGPLDLSSPAHNHIRLRGPGLGLASRPASDAPQSSTADDAAEAK